MQQEKLCDCMRIARPLSSEEKLPTKVSEDAMRASCRAWLLDNWPPVPEMDHPDIEKIDQEHDLQVYEDENILVYENGTPDWDGISAINVTRPEYSIYPICIQKTVIIPIGDGRAAFADDYSIEQGRFYLASEDAQNQEDGLESFVKVVIQQWVEQYMMVDNDRAMEYIIKYTPVSLRTVLNMEGDQTDTHLSDELIEKFRRSVLLRAGLPATPSTARYFLKRISGLPIDEDKDFPTRGAYVVTFGIMTIEQESGSNHAEALALDQIVHQIKTQSWITDDLLRAVHKCAKKHSEWLLKTVKYPCDCMGDPRYLHTNKKHPILNVPNIDLRDENQRPHTPDKRKELIDRYANGEITKKELYNEAYKIRKSEVEAKGRVMTPQDKYNEKKLIDARLDRRKIK